MEIGKLPNDVLEKIVFSNIKKKRDEVIVRAGVGKDNAIIDFNRDLCIISTDPITGTEKDIGKLAINISCNDIAVSGGEPLGVLLTIMAPPNTTVKDIENIMIEAGRAACELNVEIIGGHTEITAAVNRMVLSATVIGKQNRNKIIDPSKVKVGDKIIMTKWAGIEGTSIIVKEMGEKWKEKLSIDEYEDALNMDNLLSVLKEGLILGKLGANYMHDITEGGVYGAVWEASKVIEKGVKIWKENIPIKEVTKRICESFDINPYRLISSGSMLAVVPSGNIEEIKENFIKEGIKLSVIGEIIEEGIFVEEMGKKENISEPGSDELYKALSKLS